MSATEATPNDALNPHGSAWVGANAGAGKTYILVSRLVRLMFDGVAPEKLLCLTYTRAAAAEMQSRLFDLLAEWALLDDAHYKRRLAKGWAARPTPKRWHAARVLFARALETPGGLRVQTIHGFCESLLKRFPLEAGLSPHFDLMDEQEAQNLQSAIIADLLLGTHSAARTEAMAVLTRALAENDVIALGRQILARRDAFDSARAAKIYVYWRKRCSLIKGGKPMALCPTRQPCCTQAGQKFLATAKAAMAWYEGGTANDQKQAARLQKWLDAYAKTGAAGAETAWVHLRSVFFTEQGGARQTLYNAPLASKNPNWPLRWIAPPKIWRGLMNRSKR